MDLSSWMISKQPKVFWTVDCWDFGTKTCQSFPKMLAGISDIEFAFNDNLTDTMFPVS